MSNNFERDNYFNDSEFDIKQFINLIIRNKVLIITFTSISIIVSILNAISIKRTWSGNFQIVLKQKIQKMKF